MIPSLLPAFPEIILAAGACILLLLGVVHDAAKACIPILTKSLVVAILLYTAFSPAITVIAFNGLFIADNFAAVCKVLILGFTAAVLVASRKTLIVENILGFEYQVLLLFAVLGMMVMVSANDLLSVFMGLELQSLSMYIMVAFRREDGKSSEAALKYFVLGALSTGILLFGISLIYGFASTTQFPLLAAHFAKPMQHPWGIWVGLVFVMVGLAFKIAVVPFHMWIPDVYQGVPTSVATFLATAPKLSAFALLLRVLLGPFNGLAAQWSSLCGSLAIASMLLGGFAALRQANLKRLLAYSSIGNIGYALIGIASIAAQASLFYIVVYTLAVFGVFVCILSLLSRGLAVESIEDLRGLAQTYPGIALMMSLFLFSMAGIPPLAGFLGKLYVFQAAIHQGLNGLAIVGVLTSVVAAAYYLYIIKIMVMDDPLKLPAGLSTRKDPLLGLLIGLIVVLMVVLFVNPSLLMEWVTSAVHSLTDPKR